MEPYRTLLGHFRHEIAHYFWDHLVASSPAIDEFRQLFGDERQDNRDVVPFGNGQQCALDRAVGFVKTRDQRNRSVINRAADWQ